VRSAQLVPVFNVVCVMCSRSAGQIVCGRFVRRATAQPPVRGRDGSRCGECGGNLYLEPAESVTQFMASQLVQPPRTNGVVPLRAA